LQQCVEQTHPQIRPVQLVTLLLWKGHLVVHKLKREQRKVERNRKRERERERESESESVCVRERAREIEKTQVYV
jgi:hypothetical protein